MPNIESIESQGNEVVVGLFGTCGNSTWRKDVIEKLDENGVHYFNPQKEGWKDEYAKIEATHLANDEVIVLPITKDTYGSASLAEVGFSIKEITDGGRDVVLYIEPDLLESLNDENARSESLKARAMLIARLPEIARNNPNVHLVGSIDELAQKAVELIKEEREIKPEKAKEVQGEKGTVIYNFDASELHIADMAEMSLDMIEHLDSGKKVMIYIEEISKPDKADPDFTQKDESRRARSLALKHLEEIASKNPNLVLCTKEQIHDAIRGEKLHEATSSFPVKGLLDDITYDPNKGKGE